MAGADALPTESVRWLSTSAVEEYKCLIQPVLTQVLVF